MDIIIVLILGVVIGSFINVCIYRIPSKETFVFSRSHCRKCNHTLFTLDLFPVISYILLKGKCRYCKSKISLQYPLIETVNAVFYLILFLKFGATYKFLCYIFFLSVMIIIFFIDMKHKIIPNIIIFIAFIAILILKLSESIYYLSYIPILKSILGFIFSMIPLIIVALITKGGIGGGDIKLIGIIGMWFGIWTSYIILFFSIISASIVSLYLLVLKYKTLKSEIAFGPFITSVVILYLIWSDYIVELMF